MFLFTDASGSEGWDAYWSGRWLQDRWSSNQQKMNITRKELYAIVMAVNTWGVSWQHQKILLNCDNLAVVDIWAKGTTKSPEVMALVWLLYFCAACYNINVSVQHISGTENKIADANLLFSGHLLQGTGSRCRCNTSNIPAWPTQAFKIASCNSAIMVSPSQPIKHTSLD